MSEDNGNSEPFEPVESKDETFGAETPVTGQTKMQAAANVVKLLTGVEEYAMILIMARHYFIF